MPIHGANRTGDDRGETLLELVIAVVILGIAVVAIVGGLASSVLISDVHRLQAAITADQANYVACAGPANYVPSAAAIAATGFTVPSGYTATASVQYWDGSAFGACPAGGDTGLQRVSLTVTSDNGRARQSLVVLVRKPCRPTDAACS
jgi:Tfp pilus assembly protein PilV